MESSHSSPTQSTVWNGTADINWYNPSKTEFTINTSEQLAGLAYLVNNDFDNFKGKTITLDANIQLNDTTLNGGWRNWETSNEGLMQWTTIGTHEKPFCGKFNGAEHTISGLYISTISNYQGLFGYINSGVLIEKVGVISGYVKGGNDIGFLVGYNSGTISSYATGIVSGDKYVGGLVGYNDGGKISNSRATSDMSGSECVGGLVGYNRGKINNSNAKGKVDGNYRVGGLMGCNDGGTISNSHASGNVDGSAGVGGVAGYNSGTISESYASGNVNGNYAGGLVGYNDGGKISNSYAEGSVHGYDGVGGLVGFSKNGEISNSYAIGKVNGNYHVGGLAGEHYGKINDSYYDKERSGQKDDDKGIPKPTADMKTQATFAGWDFDSIWTIDEGNDYPKLK